MADLTVLEKAKKALRISHDVLDDMITDTIATARAEMVRNGIAQSKSEDDTDKLITTAIVTYVLFVHGNDQKLKDGYEKSWLFQLDNLRKSQAYVTSE